MSGIVKEGETVKKKINLLGDVAVGKTSLILRYVKDVFGEEYLKTIGSNVYTKTVSFEKGSVKLIIYDIMGDRAFDSVQEMAFKGSQGAIAVIDLLRPETLDSILENWIPKYRRLSSEMNPVVPVVNKYDLKYKLEGDKWTNMPSDFEHITFTSAKTGQNVEYVFKKIAMAATDEFRIEKEDVRDMIAQKDIEEAHELLDALFAVCSSMGDIPQPVRGDLLNESGINEFDLTEELLEIEDEEVLEFGENLIDWYEKKKKKDAKEIISETVSRYRE